MAVQLTYPLYMPPGFAGMLADDSFHDIRSFAHGDSGEIPFGAAVVEAATAGQCRLPSGSGDVVIGIAVYSATYSKPYELGNIGILPGQGSPISVMQRGRIWVTVEEAVTRNAEAFVRFASGAGGTQVGSLRASADSATAVKFPGFRFLSDAAPGGLAILGVDVPAGFAKLAP